MSGGKYIKQAIIAALVEHPNAEKYKTKAFSGENLHEVMKALAEQGQKLTKQDLFTPDDEGNYIIHTPSLWKNFDKIVKIIHDNGDRLTLGDFTRPMVDGDKTKTLLKSADDSSSLGKIFTHDLWQGRFDEMERLWHKVSIPSRKALFQNEGLLDPALKRQFYTAEGKEMPEDKLGKAGISLPEFRDIFAVKGNYEVITQKLHAAGDYLRKEYLMLTDAEGDTVFKSTNSWEKYGAVVKEMKQHGEQFEVSDFVRQVNQKAPILGNAASSSAKALDKVFEPEHWKDRLQDMLKLWSFVLPAWQAPPMETKDFDKAYAAAESMTFAEAFDPKNFESKADLLRPVALTARDMPVLPLALKSTWDNFDAVQKKLSSMNEKLCLNDLREVSGEMRYSSLMCAIKLGCFDKVVDIVRASGDKITVEDFMSKDRHGSTILNILAEQHQLPLAFMPDLWVGRVQDMKLLWSQVKASDQEKVDIRQVEVAVQQATLRQMHAANRFKIKIKPN